MGNLGRSTNQKITTLSFSDVLPLNETYVKNGETEEQIITLPPQEKLFRQITRKKYQTTFRLHPGFHLSVPSRQVTLPSSAMHQSTIALQANETLSSRKEGIRIKYSRHLRHTSLNGVQINASEATARNGVRMDDEYS